jgi:hypothetical protein
MNRFFRRASLWRKVGFGLLLIAALAFGAYSATRAIDFFCYRSAAQQLLAQDYDIYLHSPVGVAYRYAPIVAFAFIPISFLPPPAGAFLWYLIKIAALIAVIGMALKLLNLDNQHLGKVLGFSLLITGGYIVEEFQTGNIHFFILFLIVLALFSLERGKTIFPSFLMAISICAKLTPLLFIPYFAIIKKWKLCLFCFLWLAVLILSPSFFVGWAKNVQLAGNWMETAIARADEPVNHSLKGVLFKYLKEKPADLETEKYPRVNLLNLRTGIINGIWILASLLLLLLLGKALLRKCRNRECPVFKYTLVMVSLLLLSPHSSRVYFSTLFFPCAVLVALAIKYPESRHRTLVLSVLGISFALNTLLPALMPGRRASLAYEALSPYFFSALFVWLVFYVLTLRFEKKIHRKSCAFREAGRGFISAS